jgi:hypothetical protein
MAVMALLSAILFPRICQAPDHPTASPAAEYGLHNVADSDV